MISYERLVRVLWFIWIFTFVRLLLNVAAIWFPAFQVVALPSVSDVIEYAAVNVVVGQLLPVSTRLVRWARARWEVANAQ
jgi:hypothetical protein